MYNLIEFSDNYEDPTASLYQFKRQEQSCYAANPKDINNLTADNSSSFKYNSGLLGTTETDIAANTNPNIPLAHRLWRNVQIIVPLKYISSFKRTLLDTAIPGVNRLFVAGFNDNDALGANDDAHITSSHRSCVERNSFTKYFLPRVDIKDYNILIDGRNFYDQNISDDFKKYEELRKVMTGRGEDYTTGSLLDYEYWKNNCKLICCDLSKQKVLDSNPKS